MFYNLTFSRCIISQVKGSGKILPYSPLHKSWPYLMSASRVIKTNTKIHQSPLAELFPATPANKGKRGRLLLSLEKEGSA